MIQQGERIRLAPLDRCHLEKMVAWQVDVGHRNIYRDFLFPWSLAEWTRFFETRLLYSQDQRIFAIEEKGGGEMVGYVSLLNINWVARTCEVAMLLEASSRHRGYALESLLVVSDYVFLKLGFRKWYMRVVAGTSLACALKEVGFHQEGVLAGHVFFDGRYHDEAILSIWASEHRALIATVRSRWANVLSSGFLDLLEQAAERGGEDQGRNGKACCGGRFWGQAEPGVGSACHCPWCLALGFCAPCFAGLGSHGWHEAWSRPSSAASQWLRVRLRSAPLPPTS